MMQTDIIHVHCRCNHAVFLIGIVLYLLGIRMCWIAKMVNCLQNVLQILTGQMQNMFGNPKNRAYVAFLSTSFIFTELFFVLQV